MHNEFPPLVPNAKLQAPPAPLGKVVESAVKLKLAPVDPALSPIVNPMQQ